MTDIPLTVAQVAELEACSVDTVRRAIRAGHLQALVLNPTARRPHYRVTLDALGAWRQARLTMPERPAERPDPIHVRSVGVRPTGRSTGTLPPIVRRPTRKDT